jgi:hypothetical protein
MGKDLAKVEHGTGFADEYRQIVEEEVRERAWPGFLGRAMERQLT